jgi:hypothetical protein
MAVLCNALSPPSVSLKVDEGNPAITHVECETGGAPVLGSVLAYVGAAMAYGVMLAFKTRRLKSDFDESSHIAITAYNVLFVAIVVGPQTINLDDKPMVAFVTLSLAGLWIIACTLGVLFGPKLVRIARRDDEVYRVKSMSSSSLGSPQGTSGHSGDGFTSGKTDPQSPLVHSWASQSVVSRLHTTPLEMGVSQSSHEADGGKRVKSASHFVRAVRVPQLRKVRVVSNATSRTLTNSSLPTDVEPAQDLV